MQRKFEIQHLIGRRVVGSFTVDASSYSEADKLSEPERRKRGISKYRIADASSRTRPKHGGVHQKAWEYRNHYD